jgi:hypothetical protein
MWRGGGCRDWNEAGPLVALRLGRLVYDVNPEIREYGLKPTGTGANDLLERTNAIIRPLAALKGQPKTLPGQAAA